MGISNKSFRGLSSEKKRKIMTLNKEIERGRLENIGKHLNNWQTSHKGYGEPLKEKK